MSSKDNSVAPALPRGWSVETLGSISSDKQGSLNPLDYPDELFDHYSIPAYQEAGLPATEVGASILSLKQLVCKDTVLFGKLNPRVEKVWLVREKSPRRQIASTEWLPVLPKSAAYNSHYLYYLMWSTHVMPKAQTMVSGSTPSRQRVDPTGFYKIPVPIPPLPEQRKIAAVLSKHWKAVEAQAAIIVNLRELKKSMMNRLFTHGLRGEPLKKTDIGMMPKSWAVKTLSSECEKPQYGFTASASSDRVGPQFLRITDITENGVNWETVPFCSCPDDDFDRVALKHNDIVFARIGATTGKSFLVLMPPKAVFASYLIRVRPKQDVVPEYLYYFFNSDGYWRQVNAEKGSSLKQGVNGSVLASLLFPKPSKDEQSDIAGLLVAFDKAIRLHEAKKSALEDLFKAMLNKLLTGTIRVKDLDIDTNEVEV